MIAALWVARRELAERKIVLAGAGLLALLAVAAPWLPWWSRWPAADVRSVAGLVLAAVFSMAVALGLGVSMLGSDLSEGRVGFFLSRPISPLALWGGKLAGSWVLTVAATFIVLLPALAQRGFLARVDLEPGQLATAFLAVPLGLICLAHAVGVMWRDASLRLVVDVVAAVGVLAVAAAATRRLLTAFAFDAITRAEVAVAVVVVVALLVAGAVGLSRGRSVLAANHSALSATLWSLLGATALGLVLYASWVRAAGPADLTTMRDLAAAPAGPWIAVNGEARGRGLPWAGFLVDTSSGRFVRLGAQTGAKPGALTFSADGRHAAFLSLSGGQVGDREELLVVDLTAREPRPTATGIFVDSGKQSAVILSDNGDRVGVVANGSVAVYELESARLLGAVRLPEDVSTVRAYFEGEELCLDLVAMRPVRGEHEGRDVQVYLDLYRFDPVARKLVRTGGTEDLGEEPVIVPTLSPDRRTLLIACGTGDARAITLHDAHTGAWVATLVDRPTGRGRVARFLADGRIVVSRLAGDHVGLELFSALGAPLGQVDLGEGMGLRLGGEAAPNRLIVAIFRAGFEGISRTRLVDVDRGTSVEIGEGWSPLWWVWAWLGGGLGQAPAPGSLASQLVYRWSDRPEFARVDPQSGALRALAGLPRR